MTYRGYPGGTLGFYRGDVVQVDRAGNILVSIAGFYGASGSAVVRDGRAVGVLVAGHMDHGPAGAIVATGLGDLRVAKAEAEAVLDRLESAPLETVLEAVRGSIMGDR